MVCWSFLCVLASLRENWLSRKVAKTQSGIAFYAASVGSVILTGICPWCDAICDAGD